jgi:hypothetical protein
VCIYFSYLFLTRTAGYPAPAVGRKSKGATQHMSNRNKKLTKEHNRKPTPAALQKLAQLKAERKTDAK